MDTRIITFDLPVALLAVLEDTAHKRRITLGQLLRDAVTHQLGAQALQGGGHWAGYGADDHRDHTPCDAPTDDEVIDRFDRGPPPLTAPDCADIGRL